MANERLTCRQAKATGSMNFHRLAALLTLATIATGAILWML